MQKGRVIALVAALFAFGCQNNSQSVTPPRAPASSVSQPQPSASTTDAELSARLKTIADRAGGNVSVSVIHLESGRAASVNGAIKLPLYSVFKLPLAVAVLKDVEEKRLQIDQKVRVTPADIVPGTRSNTEMWAKPVDRTIAELINVSIALSDNTSSAKLLQLAGGPDAVTRRLRALGFEHIDIRADIRDFISYLKNPNTGSANDLAKLLVRLQQGELLQPKERDMLLASMQRATTGLRRLRRNLPPGTVVGDKTGSGELNQTTGAPNSTNDVGLITLPDNGGHLAIAVLLNGSALPDVGQEKVIAEIAKVAYDAFVAK